MNSSLAGSIERDMSVKLREVQMAIGEYRITGGRPITEKVEAVFGHVVLGREFRNHAKDDEVGEKFWQFMTRLATVSTIATGGFQLIHEVQEYLLASAQKVISRQNEARNVRR